MNIQGTVEKIFDTVEVSEKFRKREFVVNTGGDYPQQIIMQMTQDKCENLDSIKVGENVDVSVNIRGREWTNPEGVVKYFVTIEAWKVDVMVEDAPAQGGDDLPF